MAFLWKDKKSGSWYLDYTPSGGKRVRKRIGKSKQAAQLALKEVEYQLSFDRAGVSTPDVMLGDFFEKYEQTVKAKLRPKSWIRYRAIIDHFRAWLWLMEDGDTLAFAEEDNNYPNYGAPILAKICEKYGFEKPESVAAQRMAQGLECDPDGCPCGCGQ